MEISNVKIDWAPILEGQIKYLEDIYPDAAIRETYRDIIERLNENKIKSRIIINGITVAGYAFVIESALLNDRIYGSLGFTDGAFATEERIRTLVEWAENIAKAQGKYLMINEIFRAEDTSEKFLTERGYTMVKRSKMEISLDEFSHAGEKYPKEFEILPAIGSGYQEYSRAEFDAYAGTPDMILFHTNSEADRISMVKAIFNGSYGEIVPSASTVVRHHGKLIAAIIATTKPERQINERRAMIVDIFVNREYRGNGLGTALMANSLNRLKELGFEIAELWVTSGNDAAHIYERLGFRSLLSAKEIFYYRKP
ncbi:MAG: GNAT family N-acetyltransferase [Thermoplasmataceae archaeon]